tara:strand:+ start:2467 stop:2646 length:180 start_codon:yes stop_codon:yes gene_type:complete
MENYLNRSATAAGLTIGSAGNVFAATSLDSVTDLLPVIVELAVVIALLGMVIKMLGKMQ